MAAEAQSLVEWVNSFGEGECASLKELSSGELLLKCINNVLSDLTAERGQEWPALLQVLAEFYGCSLHQSLSRELIETGDEEHIARAVVLLLSLAVQRKPNEDIISRIKTLHYKAQCDIMFFIEETLAKTNSTALSSGLFTSGVGDMVPSLSGRGTPEVTEEDMVVMEEGEKKILDEISGCGSNELVSTPQPTPNRLNKALLPGFSSVPRSISHGHVNRASYYQGLESPAAVQWMQLQKKRPSARRVRAVSSRSPRGESDDLPEEVLKLQHRVRVLERSLLNEQTLSQEMHATLCQKEREIHELKAALQKTESLEEKARELGDVQDELQTVVKALEKSERVVQRLQRECEEQRASQQEEVEKKVSEVERLESENSQLKELLEKAVAEELEQRSEVKRLQLSGETAAIAFQAKQRECDSLHQINQEVSSELREMKKQCDSLQQKLTNSTDSASQREKTLTDENHTLSMKLVQAQEELEVVRGERKVLEGECESVKQQLMVAEAGSVSLLEQYQRAVGETEKLETHCRMVEGEVEEARAREREIEARLREREREMSAEMEEVRVRADEREREMRQEVEEREGELMMLRKSLDDQIGTLERRCEAAEQEVAERERAMKDTENKFSQQVSQLEQSLARVQEELAIRESELSSLTHTSLEQKKQMEEMLADTHQKLNSLTERYTTESEEMAAVKASIEEDLSRTHSELHETRWDLLEKERALGEWERAAALTRDEVESLKTKLERVSSESLCVMQEREVVEGEKEKLEEKLREVSSWAEVRERRWQSEREALENRVVELSQQNKEFKDTVQVSKESWEKERDTWVVHEVQLQKQLSEVREEMEGVSGKSLDLEKEKEELRVALEKTQCLGNTLQEEVSSKSLSVAALEKELEEARTECSREREQRRERESALQARLEREQRRVAEVEAESERISRDSKYSLERLQADYQSAVAEKERLTQLYNSELTTLKQENCTLQLQQSETSTENAAILEKQSELYNELSSLQETKTEAMELCRRYEQLYEEEREKRQADREQIRRLRAEAAAETQAAGIAANSLRKQLSEEKRSSAVLGAENRSLKAQVSFLERKLRDSERSVSQPALASSRPSLSDPILPDQHYTTDHTNTISHYRDTSENLSRVPTDILVSQTHIPPSDTSFTEGLYPRPQHHSTAVKETQFLQQKWMQPFHSQEREDDSERISELRKRNRSVLPHLKSSYAVELQEKKEEEACVLSELGTKGKPRRNRGTGHAGATLRLTSSSITSTEETRKRTSGSLKSASDVSSTSSSPAPSRRRISDPLTTPQSSLSPATLEADSTIHHAEISTADQAGFSLAGLTKRDENFLEEPPPATMFEMNFSPPARGKPANTQLPERLKQRLTKREKQVKPVSVLVKPVSVPSSTAGGIRRQSSVANKPTQQPSRSGKRPGLRAKN